MQNYIEPQRDQYVDFLRGLGLLMLIVAHCWAPSWINRLRGFDVPLMVFVSAICYKPLMGVFSLFGQAFQADIYTSVCVSDTAFRSRYRLEYAVRNIYAAL